MGSGLSCSCGAQPGDPLPPPQSRPPIAGVTVMITDGSTCGRRAHDGRACGGYASACRARATAVSSSVARWCSELPKVILATPVAVRSASDGPPGRRGERAHSSYVPGTQVRVLTPTMFHAFIATTRLTSAAISSGEYSAATAAYAEAGT
jgi:hypothetical protein